MHFKCIYWLKIKFFFTNFLYRYSWCKITLRPKKNFLYHTYPSLSGLSQFSVVAGFLREREKIFYKYSGPQKLVWFENIFLDPSLDFEFLQKGLRWPCRVIISKSSLQNRRNEEKFKCDFMNYLTPLYQNVALESNDVRIKLQGFFESSLSSF